MVTDIMKMHSFYLFLILVTSWRWSMAQDVSKFKILDDSAYQSNIEYLSGNKYQKDAILFMDMVADTHPYYVKAHIMARCSRTDSRTLVSWAVSRASSLRVPMPLPSMTPVWSQIALLIWMIRSLLGNLLLIIMVITHVIESKK